MRSDKKNKKMQVRAILFALSFAIIISFALWGTSSNEINKTISTKFFQQAKNDIKYNNVTHCECLRCPSDKEEILDEKYTYYYEYESKKIIKCADSFGIENNLQNDNCPQKKIEEICECKALLNACY